TAEQPSGTQNGVTLHTASLDVVYANITHATIQEVRVAAQGGLEESTLRDETSHTIQRDGTESDSQSYSITKERHTENGLERHEATLNDEGSMRETLSSTQTMTYSAGEHSQVTGIVRNIDAEGRVSVSEFTDNSSKQSSMSGAV